MPGVISACLGSIMSLDHRSISFLSFFFFVFLFFIGNELPSYPHLGVTN